MSRRFECVNVINKLESINMLMNCKTMDLRRNERLNYKVMNDGEENFETRENFKNRTVLPELF